MTCFLPPDFGAFQKESDFAATVSLKVVLNGDEEVKMSRPLANEDPGTVGRFFFGREKWVAVAFFVAFF